jgi:transcriptional antiterminator NusG
VKTLDEKRVLSKWFAYTANWFVLFVQSREEQRIAERIQNKLDAEKYVVFVPTRDYAFRNGNGKFEVQQRPWLSGYVFIVTTAGEGECLEAVTPFVHQSADIYKFLSNGGEVDSVKLSERDKSVMTTILDENFNIPALEAVLVGDKVQIMDGTLEGMGGKVKRVNKHKRIAVLEIEMFGTTIECEVMLDILAKPEGV